MQVPDAVQLRVHWQALQGAHVHRACRDEEKAFVKTLNSGRARFEKLADVTLAAGGKALAGKDAFLLWDTFGYPLDLTQARSLAGASTSRC